MYHLPVRTLNKALKTLHTVKTNRLEKLPIPVEDVQLAVQRLETDFPTVSSSNSPHYAIWFPLHQIAQSVSSITAGTKRALPAATVRDRPTKRERKAGGNSLSMFQGFENVLNL